MAATEVDFQVLVFMIFFAVATIIVTLTRRRKRRYDIQSRCRACGRTLDPNRDKEALCIDCHRLGRI